MADSRYLLKLSNSNKSKCFSVAKQLESQGLVVDTNYAQDEHIIIVTASNEKLAHTAERVRLFKQLKNSDEVQEFTAAASSDNFEQFDKHNLFSPAEKSWLLYHTMQQIPYDEQATADKKEMGYLSWLQSGKHPVLEEAYPLHVPKERRALSSKLKWSLMPWRKLEVDSVRNYYGEDIGFYFGWMNFYFMFLTLPAVVGFMLYMLRPTGISVDNDPYLPFYSLFIAVWGVLFIRHWQRQSAVHSFNWNTYKLNPVDELRPEFHGTHQINPVTGQPDLYYPSWKRRLWHVFSLLCMVPLLLLGVGAMTLSLNLNGYVKHTDSPIYVDSLAQFSKPGGLFAADSKYYGWLVPTVMHSIIISVINKLYSYVALLCTDLENHRTVQSWHSSLVIKRVSFECFDCFMPLLYIAFYQMDVVTLRTEIASLFMSDEIRRILLESLVPFLTEIFVSKRIQYNKRAGKQKQCASEGCPPVDLILAEYDEFDDYLEMVIQFGYVTLFAAAFPLGPAVTLLFVYLELRSDLFKLLHAYKRPFPRRAKDIGVWFVVMQAMVFVSILTNCAIMGFSSEQMMQWLPWLFDRSKDDGDQTLALGRGRYVVGIMFGMEHLLILVALFLLWFIQPVPKKIRVAIARRKYLAKRRLHQTAGKTKTE